MRRTSVLVELGAKIFAPPRLIAPMPTHDLWMAAFHDSEGNIHQFDERSLAPEIGFTACSGQLQPRATSAQWITVSFYLMHDLNYFRDHPDVFADMAKRRAISLDLDAFRALDKERRQLITANEQRKAQRNKASEEIARLKKEKQNADGLIAEMKQVSESIKQSDERVAELDATQRDLLLTIPNLPHSSVPVGASAADNVEVRRWGAPPKI